jgi:hypothetical protein
MVKIHLHRYVFGELSSNLGMAQSTRSIKPKFASVKIDKRLQITLMRWLLGLQACRMFVSVN